MEIVNRVSALYNYRNFSDVIVERPTEASKRKSELRKASKLNIDKFWLRCHGGRAERRKQVKLIRRTLPSLTALIIHCDNSDP